MRATAAWLLLLLLGGEALATVPRQVTGKGLRVGQTRFVRAEPADPFIDRRPDGTYAIYGTGPRARNGRHRYPVYASWKDLLAGRKLREEAFHLKPALSGLHAQPWDLLVHRWPGGPEVLYGGVMTPTGRRTQHARFPHDNWTRRVYAFTRDANGSWVMSKRPLFNPIAPGQKESMIGHAYGHHFATYEREGKAETWLFHEEVTREIDTPRGKRLVTEMFARKMLDPFTASTQKVKLLGVGDPPRLGRRLNGDHLVEGPRPFSVVIAGERYHFITFSSGDFATDNYDIHFAYRRGDPIGPYTPLLDKDGQLARYAEQLKPRYSMVGRAHVLDGPDGAPHGFYHATDKRLWPGVDFTTPPSGGGHHRSTHVAELRFGRLPDGTPTIEPLELPR
jgi:hypothetical protein